MQRFIASKRINESNIRELDQKVQMESYLREKKEAILEDRKNFGDLKVTLTLGNNAVEEDNDDQKSCLQQV